MDLRSTIAARIKSMGYTLGSLGREVGVDPSIISRYVRGERDVEAATFDRLCGALGLVLVPRETTVGRAGIPPCPDEEVG
jgi:transcriptional regulator with XRE-family HTH domain